MCICSLDDLLLQNGYPLGRHFHSQVTARDHHAIHHIQDAVKIIKDFRFFKFGDHQRSSLPVYVTAVIFHRRPDLEYVLHGANERDRNSIHPMLQTKRQVRIIFFGETSYLQVHAGQVYALVGGEHSCPIPRVP